MRRSSSKKARFACHACRRLKRRCTKEVPSCSLCIRLDKDCSYPARAYKPSLDSSGAAATTTSRIGAGGTASEGRSTTTTTTTQSSPERRRETKAFPALYFLDPENTVPRLASSSTVCLQYDSSDGLLDGLWDSLVQDDDDNGPPSLEVLVNRYFATVHGWLPILSKKQLYRTLAQQQAQRTDPNFAVLLVCMRLLATCPSPPPDHQQQSSPALICPRYLFAKESLTKAETRCLPSLSLLQATILVATYELAHGIYPAAYLSAGHAARLGIMMGFHNREHCPQMFHSPVTWTGREEERRAWWAVVILDRLAHLGIHGMPLAAPEPHPGELLPASDDSWDLGAIGVNDALFVMSSTSNATEAMRSSNTGSFANLCQSAHLLGLVLRHREELTTRLPKQPPPQQQQAMVASLDGTTTPIVSDDAGISFHIREARQLHHATSAFTRHLCSGTSSHSSTGQAESGDPGLLGAGVAVDEVGGGGAPSKASAAMAVAFSARIILYGLYACNERWEGTTRSAEETALQQLALGGIYEVALEVARMARRQLQLLLLLSVEDDRRHDEEGDGEETDDEAEREYCSSISPLICHCLYQVAGECEWLILEDENSEAAGWIWDVVELLGNLAQRWQVAGAYLADITSWPGYKQVLDARLEGLNIAV
ncbi:hypothetical protein PG987_005054 [Apiospora arundinis]